ncbi:zf-TFIIB domain-containing protein [Streptomyces bluensis]|uniref:zf-TFIIB domain-containing protein n=1 Tax=Streptomyces bluensis TaxID=33897 RepID=UPI0036CE71BE
MKKVACPHCGQDWIHQYRRKDTGAQFFMCPECESLWLDQDEIEEPTELYLSEYMTQHDAASAWEVIEQVD